jgi:[protein release factor]-glutamine N5-methyltransferase (EC 2.1.1.-)
MLLHQAVQRGLLGAVAFVTERAVGGFAKSRQRESGHGAASVAVALECLRPIRAPRVLELGTGSGCIAISVQCERADARVTATDVSAAALAVAQANAQALGATVTFLHGDWYAAVGPGAAFDLIVSNPPYIAAADPHLEALAHEPALALTDGGDGLRCLTALIAGARAHLGAGGWLALEHGFDQAAAVAALMRTAGFAAVDARRDAARHPRVTLGRA